MEYEPTIHDTFATFERPELSPAYSEIHEQQSTRSAFSYYKDIH